MKILIVFGSESDKPYYDPIHQSLAKKHDTSMEVISAHRHHKKLANYLQENTFDVILAGAGIAAHLPGVVASQLQTPVIGLAVPAQYNGLDAFASILQMPFGVPVATTMATQIDTINQALDKIDNTPLEHFDHIHLVIDKEADWMKRELDRSIALIKDLGYKYSISEKLSDHALNIILHRNENYLSQTNHAFFNIPLMETQNLAHAETLIDVFKWSQEGGLWCGTNNTRNAILMLNKFKKLKEKAHFEASFTLYRHGSSKDLYQKNGDNSHVYFGFTDRYSAFDWGEMPNKIPNKGLSQARFSFNIYRHLENPKTWQHAAFNERAQEVLDKDSLNDLENLKGTGLKTHVKDFIYINEKPLIKANAYQVFFPKFTDGHYDYSDYESKPEQAMVPLEMIFRFGIPSGSSMLKRSNDKAYCAAINAPEKLEENSKFKQPLLEFSTKFESKDSFIYPEVAQKIASLTENEFKQIQSLTRLIALQLETVFSEMGIELWDGKLEFAFGQNINGDREIILVDTLGVEELRLNKSGKKLSKEVLRQYYQGTAWKQAMEMAKCIAEEEKTDDWKQVCIERLHAEPHLLDDSEIGPVAEIYESVDAALAEYIDEVQLMTSAV